MANMDRILHIEMSSHRGQVVRIVIHVMAVAYLGGPSMTTAVVRDHAIAMIEEEQHLRVPVIGGKRPAVGKHDGLSGSPVLVIDFDSVFRRYCGHENVSRSWVKCVGVREEGESKALKFVSGFV